MQAAVALHTLSSVLSDRSSAVVLSSGIDAARMSDIGRSCPMLDVTFVDVGSLLPRTLPVTAGFPLFTYARLLVPDVLGSDVGRALYLDCDVLVVDDPTPLLSLDLEGAPAAAVRDFDTPTVACAYGLADWRALELHPSTPYFNAGVLVMDLEAWLAADISGRTFAYARQRPDRLRCADQDALNAVVRGGFASLPLRWNAQPPVRKPECGLYAFFGAGEVDAARDQPGIVHFSEAVKPWHSGSTDPLSSAWRAEIAATAWSGWRPPLRQRIDHVRRRITASARALLRD
jgi:lipopolysaccharide biosynthesis glycosyltransferase